MKYQTEVYNMDSLIDEFTTTNPDEEAVRKEYPEATQVVFTPMVETLNPFLVQKINTTEPEYISSIDSHGGFFVEYESLDQKLLRKLFSVADVFGYRCSIGKANKFHVKFNKK